MNEEHTKLSEDEMVAGNISPADEEAFRLIFDRYSRPVLSFIYDMVGDRALAEDLMQETFVRAYRRLSTLREETKLSIWLFAIAKNVARESLRTQERAHKHEVAADKTTAELPTAATPEHLLAVEEALTRTFRRLSETERQIFSLYIEGFEPKEIAGQTGASPATVYRAIKNATLTVLSEKIGDAVTRMRLEKQDIDLLRDKTREVLARLEAT